MKGWRTSTQLTRSSYLEAVAEPVILVETVVATVAAVTVVGKSSQTLAL